MKNNGVLQRNMAFKFYVRGYRKSDVLKESVTKGESRFT